MKWLEYALKILLAAGVIGLLGAAGASDLERITLWQSIWQVLCSAGLSAGAYVGLRLCKAVQKRRAQRRVVYLYTPGKYRPVGKAKRRVQAQN